MIDTRQSEVLSLIELLDGDQPTILRVHAENAGKELLRQHYRIAELEDQLFAVGAGGIGLEPLRKSAAATVAVPPLTPDEARRAAQLARLRNGPSDTTQPSEYAMAGALALAAKLAAAPAQAHEEKACAARHCLCYDQITKKRWN